MSRVDRYILSQFLWLFGFFALILVSVFWINRAVVLFDRLIGDGQNVLVFLEFTALALPPLILTVIPIATFAAAVYVTNRLNNESELTVMLATGSSPWRLARPVVVFGLIVAVMVSILAHLLVPAARTQLSEREREVAGNVTARLLKEGAFLNPSSGITFYSREIGSDGILHDVFLSDLRNPEEGMIYTAAEAYLVRGEDEETTLIMLDGLAQRMQKDGQRLSTAKFEDFSFDISALVQEDRAVRTRLQYINTWRLIVDQDAVATETRSKQGAIANELHGRLVRPVFAMVTALVGFAALLVGGYSRFGVWREIVLAFGLLVLIDGMRGVVSPPVIQNAAAWPLIYLPSLVGILIVALLLSIASKPRWLQRKVPA